MSPDKFQKLTIKSTKVIDVNDLLTLITNAIFACLLRNPTTMPSSNGIKPLQLDDDDDDLR